MVELDDGELERRGRSDGLDQRHGAVPRSHLVGGRVRTGERRVEGAVLRMHRDHPVPQTLEQRDRVDATARNPVEVDFEDHALIEESGEDLEPGDTVEDRLQLVSVVVVSDADADTCTDLGGRVQQPGGLLDLLDRLPARGLGVGIDDRAHAEHLRSLEDLGGSRDRHRGAAAIRIHERLRGEERVPRRRGQARGRERRGEGSARRTKSYGSTAVKPRAATAASEPSRSASSSSLIVNKLEGGLDRHRRAPSVFGDGGVATPGRHAITKYLHMEVLVR